MNSDIRFYYKLMVRRMPAMLCIFTLCTGIAFALALTLPKLYAADATLSVQSATISGEQQRGINLEIETAKQLQVIQQRLLSRSNLIDIANKYRVFAEEDLTSDEVVAKMRDLTAIKLSSGRGQATIMEVSFTASRASTSADVVNEFVTLLLTEDTDLRVGRSRETLGFRSLQVERLDAKLSQQSAEIVKFKQANEDSLPEGLDFRLERRSTLQERLNIAARDRASLVDQRARLLAVGAPQQNPSVSLTPNQKQLQLLEAELNEALALYSELNPRVRVLRARIEQLEAALPSQPQQIDNDTETILTEPATVLDLQLIEIDSRLASLDADIARAEAEMETLLIAIEATPTVAIRLDALEREYINTQTLYNQAVAERARAEGTDQIEASRKGERLEVIEHPVAPSAPSSPRKALIVGGGMFIGTGLAAAFFVLAELLNRTIRRPKDLSGSLGIQPFATIPFMEDASTRRRRIAFKVILLGLFLMAIPIGLWALHTFYLPLDLIVENLRKSIGL